MVASYENGHVKMNVRKNKIKVNTEIVWQLGKGGETCRRKEKPNLQTKRVFDPETGETIKLRLSTSAIRTLDKVGSLSKFLR